MVETGSLFFLLYLVLVFFFCQKNICKLLPLVLLLSQPVRARANVHLRCAQRACLCLCLCTSASALHLHCETQGKAVFCHLLYFVGVCVCVYNMHLHLHSRQGGPLSPIIFISCTPGSSYVSHCWCWGSLLWRRIHRGEVETKVKTTSRGSYYKEIPLSTYLRVK